MNKLLTAILALGVVMCFNLFSKPQAALTIGSKAPEFALKNENNDTIKLSDMPGKVALVFFPKAHTLSFGCKKEMCSIRNDFSDLKDYGITTYGLSYDSPQNLKKFIENNQLPFSLLHATDAVLQAYGVKGWFGMAKRYTFLIENGIIVKIITNVDADNHAQQIIDGFKKAA
jgi:peroxiredoxin Q/BCP